MKVTRKQEKIVKRTLEGWRQEGVIDAAEQQRLQQNLSVQLFDWQRMSRYAFWVALVCAIIAIGSLVADEYLMELLFNFGYVTRAIILLLLSLAFYFWGFYRQKQTPDKRYSNEAILFLGVLFTALFLWQLGMALDNGSGNAALLFLFGCVIYGVIGYLGRSGLIWLFCLLALGSYFGTSTGYASGWGAYWLGMNYPIRFVLFGGVLLAACYLLKNLCSNVTYLRSAKRWGFCICLLLCGFCLSLVITILISGKAFARLNCCTGRYFLLWRQGRVSG